MLAEAAHGNAAMRLCCEVLRACALGRVVEVPYAGRLLTASPGDSALVWMAHDARWPCP